MESCSSDYNAFAYFYNKYWAHPAAQLFPVYEALIPSRCSPPYRILDLCCGTGQFAQFLGSKGYEVTGIDSSQTMLLFAQQNAPMAHFILSDVRTFQFPPAYSLATSTYGSLNFILTSEELFMVFKNVYASLNDNAYFIFDLCMHQRYEMRRGSFGKVDETDACITQTRYCDECQVACSNITLFQRGDNSWQRSDITLLEKCYTEEQIQGILKEAGFASSKMYDAVKEFHLKNQIGRSIFIASKGDLPMGQSL